MNTEYFHWSGDPVLINFGSIPLPFPVSIYGLIAAIVLFFYGLNKLDPSASSGKKGKRKKNKDAQGPGGLKVLGLAIGAFILGQFVFAILPSPTINQLGPITIRWYGLLFLGAFVNGYFIEKKIFQDAGRNIMELEQLLTYILLGTIIGARLGHILFYDPLFYLTHPGEIIAIWHGGLASHGAAIGILAAMYLYVRKKKDMNYLWIADRVVIPVAIGGAFVRTGNFFNSEILGRPTDLPWAVVFEKVNQVPRHPTMLYEALLSIGVFALIWYMYKRYDGSPPEGSIFGTFLITLFTGRILFEYTKMPQADFAVGWAFSMGQWLSLPLVLFGVWLLWKKVDWGKP